MQIRSHARLLALLVTALTLWSSPALLAMEPTPGYTVVQQAFLREEFSSVTQLAESFLLLHPEAPETPRVWVWFALSLDRLQQTPDALAQLDALKARLASDDALWPEVLFWEADVSRRALQMMRAKLAYEQLLEQFPGSTWSSQARLGIGLIYLHQQNCAAAVPYFHEVFQRQPGTPAAWDAMLFEGLCDVRLERFADAVAILQPLIEQLRDPNTTAQASLYLGEAFSGLGRFDEAAAAYRRSTEMPQSEPWSQLALFGLGWAHFRADRCDESLIAFNRYLTTPDVERVTEAAFAQASCFMRLGRDADAAARFEEVLARDPSHPLAMESGLVLIDVYRQQERLAPAKELVHRLLRRALTPEQRARLQVRLGGVALEEGNIAQAKTVYELARSAEAPAVRQQALSGLGDLEMFLGQPGAAVAWYKEAIAIGASPRAPVGLHEPMTAYASYQLGRAELEQGRAEEAIRIFQRLVEPRRAESPSLLSPGIETSDESVADEARLALALIHLGAHRSSEAREQLDVITRERPGSLIAKRAVYYAALLALEAGDQMMAERWCRQAVLEAPQTGEAVDARLLLADLSAQYTSVGQASSELEAWFASVTLPLRQRVKVIKRLADFARAEQRFADAIRWYAQLWEEFPAWRGEAAYRVASCYEEGGDVDVAIRWYRGIAQGAWRARGQLAAAKLLERQDRLAEAKDVYRALAEQDVPEAKVAQDQLAALEELQAAAHEQAAQRGVY